MAPTRGRTGVLTAPPPPLLLPLLLPAQRATGRGGGSEPALGSDSDAARPVHVPRAADRRMGAEPGDTGGASKTICGPWPTMRPTASFAACSIVPAPDRLRLPPVAPGSGALPSSQPPLHHASACAKLF